MFEAVNGLRILSSRAIGCIFCFDCLATINYNVASSSPALPAAIADAAVVEVWSDQNFSFDEKSIICCHRWRRRAVFSVVPSMPAPLRQIRPAPALGSERVGRIDLAGANCITGRGGRTVVAPLAD